MYAQLVKNKLLNSIGLVLVMERGVEQGSVQFYFDNQSASYLAKNQVCIVRAKHIDVKFHKIVEWLAFEQILLEKVNTCKNLSDMLIKLVATIA